MEKIVESATALARLACKGVLVMLGYLCLVIFFDFGALGGPGFPAGPSAPSASPPKTMVFSKDSGGFWQVEGSPPLVGASGAPKINIF